MWAIAIACGTIAPAAITLQPVGAASDDPLAQLTALTRGYEVRDEALDRAGQPPLRLRLVLKPETADRAPALAAITKAVLLRLGAWHGPLTQSALTIVDVPWNSPFSAASFPGVLVTTMSALPVRGDRALVRAVYGAVARQYWQVPATAARARQTLGEGIAAYVAVRGIHEELARGHDASLRLAGGFLSYPLRRLPWSLPATDPRPPVHHFAEVAAGAPEAEAQRVALALWTLDRYLGWPALQQALEVLQSRWHTGDAGPADLAAILSEQRGTDMRWFVDAALGAERRFDYGIASFTSVASVTTPGEYETRLSVQRFGDGVFAGTAEPQGPLQAARSLKVQTRFADGTVIDDWWDGRDASMELAYASPSPAVLASVDPDAMLMLDGRRANNTRALEARITGAGVRLIASWLLWLQDVMLWSSALL